MAFLSSHLSNRFQYVLIILLNPVLSPLFFIIYINDPRNILSNIVLSIPFLDDTGFTTSNSNLNIFLNCITQMQCVLMTGF